MNKKELKEYFERDRKYREKSMLEAVNELVTQTDFFKSDLVKNKKRLESGDTNAFQMIKSDVISYTARFNVEKLEGIQRNWESSNEVVKALEHLDEKEKK
ncbi:hypothetical protein ES705_17927 [subsurface metagenome]|jgi:hypothetical protein